MICGWKNGRVATKVTTQSKIICFLGGAECLRMLVGQSCFLLFRYRGEYRGSENEEMTESEMNDLY